jgi:TonB family protein
MTAAAFVLYVVLAASTTPVQQTGAFSGTIRDVAGKPLQNATIIVADAQANDRWITTSNAGGEFQFDQLPARTYSVVVLSAVQTGYKNQGYEERRTSIRIEPAQEVREHFRLRLVVAIESAQIRPDLYVRPTRPTRQYLTISHQALEPNLVHRVEPVRPQTDGPSVVTLLTTIDKEGRVASLRIMAPDTNPELARAAVEAVRQWVYGPFIFRGEPSEVQTTIVLDFAAGQ